MTDDQRRRAEAFTCDEAGVLVTRAVDGVLTPGHRAALDDHLDRCSSCRGVLASHQALRRTLQALPAIDVSPDFPARVMAALPRRRSWADILDYRRWTWRLAPVAAALIVWTAAVFTRETPADDAASIAWSEVNVPAALYDASVSDEELVSLMLTAGVDAPLVDALEEARR